MLPSPEDSMRCALDDRGPVLGLLLLLLAWGALFRRPLLGLVTSASWQTLRLDLVLAVGLVGLLLSRSRGVVLRPRVRPLPAAVVGLALVAHLGLSHTIDIDLLSCTAMVAGTWGLAGFYLSSERWRQALPLAIVGVCILPMGSALDVYLGFPLRVATAGLTRAALQPLGLGEITAETIVLIEGGGVQIDLPCSGVRSLWSGAIFWATATWIERRRVGARWLLASAGFVGLLVALNGARVLTLVLLHGFAPPVAMEVLHVPLGLMAFAAAAVLGWGLLHRLPVSDPPAPAPDEQASSTRLIGALTVLFFGLSLAPSARSLPGDPPATLAAPDSSFEPVALQDDEVELFRTRRAAAVGKWTASLGDARAHLVMVQGSSWRAQHRPDVCHAAHGLRVDGDDPVLIAPELPARHLHLSRSETEAAAYYWFQSAEQTTNEYGARIWAALDGDPEPWIMVSVMVDAPLPPSDPRLRALLLQVHEHAHHLLTASPEPSP